MYKYLSPLKTGGKIRIDTYNKLLDESYEKKPKKNLDGYVLDEELSTRKDKVYYNPTTNDVAVVHRGTFDVKDIKTDLLYAIGVKDKRFKDARRVHARVDAKYTDAEKQILGHSLGGLIAQDNARAPNVKEVITLNKPVFVQDILKKKPKNQLDVRSKYDVVSFLSPLDSRAKQLQIETKEKNPVKAHTTAVLQQLPDNMEIGFD